MTNTKDHNCIGKDELLTLTQENIEKYGIQVIQVESTSYSPSFVYSIGMTQTFNYPEIICFDLPKNLGPSIINDIADLIKNGEKLVTNQYYKDIFQDSGAAFLKVDSQNIEDYFLAALNYYGDKHFEALQLVWTDRNDKFPWEDGFEEVFYTDSHCWIEI